jgi:hypothetical protein
MREIEPRLRVQLPTGTALVHNAHWGTAHVRVRPPYSKVFELRETEIRQLVGPDKGPSKTVTNEAHHLAIPGRRRSGR